MNRFNNSGRTILMPVIIAVSIIAGVLLANILPGNTNRSGTTIKPRTDKISDLLNIIDAKYVDTINRKDLEEKVIPYLLSNLDPHSVYIPARDLQAMNEPLQGNFEGIGVSFNKLRDTVLIISTIPGGPSEKVGVMAGDKIIFVGDSLIAGTGIPDNDIIGMLKGPSGTEVTIRVLRKGSDELLPFTIQRGKIPIFSVDVAYMIDDEIGFIKVSRFAMTTYDEFVKGLEELEAAGMKKLILDLRGNVGGIMDAAIAMADEFLDGGQLIVYTEGKSYPREEAFSTDKGSFREGDLAILIDEYSASASEIFAGAIQDNDRGIIVGRRSFGKGLVQEPIVFADGSALRLTIARYYTPTGRSIQKPYDKGLDEYNAELYHRFQNGENFDRDSIHLADTLKFVTPGGKIVYGGGGIMPDYFVPSDTSGITMYFMRARNAGLIYRFALQYAFGKSEVLDEFKTATDLENYLDRQPLLSEFTSFAEKNGLIGSPTEIRESADLIDIQLKAYIARNILDNKGFYPIWQHLDKTLQKAIEILREDQAEVTSTTIVQ